MINNKPITNSKKSHIYIYIYILIVFYLIAIFLPFVSRNSVSSTANTNNTSVSSNSENNNSNVGSYDFAEQTFSALKNSGNMICYPKYPGGKTGMDLSGSTYQSYLTYRTGYQNSAGSSTAHLWRANDDWTGGEIPTGLSATWKKGAVPDVYDAACNNMDYTTRINNFGALLTSQTSGFAGVPTITINPAVSDVGVYYTGVNQRIDYYFKLDETNLEFYDVPEVFGIPKSNWSYSNSVGEYVKLWINLHWDIKVVIYAANSKAGYIDGTTTIVGTYGTAGQSLYKYEQHADPGATRTAIWSFYEAPDSRITNQYSTAQQQNNVMWTAALPPGTYTIKLQAASVQNTADTPQLTITLKINYAQPNDISFTSQNSTMDFVDGSDNSQTYETAAITATAFTSVLADSTYVKQEFTWAISSFTKNGAAFTMPSAWMSLANNASGLVNQAWVKMTQIPLGSYGAYKITLTASTKKSTTDSNYTPISESINYEFNIIPNIDNIAVTSPTGIQGKGHVDGGATDGQKFQATLTPSTYSTLPVEWNVASVTHVESDADVINWIKIDSTGKLYWDDDARQGTYTVVVSATAHNGVGYGECTVVIDYSDATFLTPAISYPTDGKRTFYACNQNNGTSNRNFSANLEQDDARAVTWSIEKVEGTPDIPSDLLYIGTTGTLNWRKTLTEDTYEFTIKATTNNDGTDFTETWKDPQADNATGVITLIVSDDPVDDVILSNGTISNLSIDSGSSGTGSELTASKTHLGDNDYTHDEITSLIIPTGNTVFATNWLTATTPDGTTGAFNLSWSGAVKGTYTFKIQLDAEIDELPYSWQSAEITCTVSDVVPTDITIGTISTQSAIVNTMGDSEDTVSAEAKVGGSAANVDQSIIWTVSDITHPGTGEIPTPTIEILFNGKIHWSALDVIGNWTFKLTATSAIASSIHYDVTVTINVQATAPDTFYFDSSTVLAGGTHTFSNPIGTAFTSTGAPTLTATFRNNADWVDPDSYTVGYSIGMLQGGSATAAKLTIDSTSHKLKVGADATVGSYEFQILLTVTFSDNSTYTDSSEAFYLNVTKVAGTTCVMGQQLGTTTLQGYKGFSFQTSTATSDVFKSHMEKNGVDQNDVEQDTSLSIIMTNGDPTPSWLTIGGSGQIAYTPDVSGTFSFKVKATSSGTGLFAISTNTYTLTVDDGTTPDSVQINNDEELMDALSNITWESGKAGSSEVAVNAQANSLTSDPYILTGIVYSLSGTNIPSWLHIDSTTGVISWDNNWEVGEFDITIKATSVDTTTDISDILSFSMNFSVSDAPTDATGLSQLAMILIIAIPAGIIGLIACIYFMSRKHISGGLKKKR